MTVLPGPGSATPHTVNIWTPMVVGKMRNWGMRNAEGKMRHGPEWNVRSATAERCVICGMRKVALSAVGCIFTQGAKHIRWRRRHGRDSFNSLEAGDAVRPNHLQSLLLRQRRSSLIADAASRETCLSNWLYSCIEDTIFVVSILHCWLVSVYCLSTLIELCCRCIMG